MIRLSLLLLVVALHIPLPLFFLVLILLRCTCNFQSRDLHTSFDKSVSGQLNSIKTSVAQKLRESRTSDQMLAIAYMTYVYDTYKQIVRTE